jgi:hypothetical protein
MNCNCLIFCKNARRAFFALVFLGSFLFSGNISAQSGVTFVDPARATSILLGEIDVIHQVLPALPQGSQLKHDYTLRVAYFKGIFQAINESATVAHAIELGLGQAANLGGEGQDSSASQAELDQVRNEAIDLLKL